MDLAAGKESEIVDSFAEQPTDLNNPDDIALADRMKAGREQILVELRKKIIGQQEVINETLLTLFVGGNSLIIGVPGLAKTLLIQTMAQVLDLKFSRIQFTPDLMPGELTGTEAIEDGRGTRRGNARFNLGPVFTQVPLEDEISRALHKARGALLQAMQEGHVTAGGEVLELPRPFFVLATQNPIEQEGTYPLPEAQLDRFMLKISMDYPDGAEEVEVLRSTTGKQVGGVTPVLNGAQVLELQGLVREIAVSDEILEYTARLVRSSRPGRPEALDITNRWVRWCAGPRAGAALILCAKASALMRGRLHVSSEDLARVAPAVLRHRILVNFQAEAEGRTPDEVVRALLDGVTPLANERS